MAHMTVAAKADFPLYAMRMKDFLALEELRPHNDLVKAGIVVPMESVPDGDSINFVSHQWLGFKVADPKNEHLRTMQAVFRLCGGDDPTQAFRDEEQWTGYSQGMSKSNVSANAVDNFTGELTEIEQRGKSTEDFRRSVGPETSWVWMDYLSIPQTVTCTTEEEVEQSLKGQAAAIRSIPNYVASAHNFFICAPRDATHVDLCQPCNLATWQKRGWCRLEEAILMLTRGGDGRPLYVTENIGAPPKLFTHDSIDRLWMHTQRHASVLTGDFSCCRMEHVVATPDGKQVPIPCDKTLLGSVLTDVLQGQLDELAPVALGDAKEGASFIQNVGASFAQEGKPFFTFFSLQVLKGAILADHAVEQSTDLERWPQYSDGVATEDQAKSYFDVFQLSALDEKNWGEAIFNAAIEGNLPMLRYFHEKLGVELSYSNPFDMTPLLVAARQGNDATVKYICERVSTEDINKTSKKLGLSGKRHLPTCSVSPSWKSIQKQ